MSVLSACQIAAVRLNRTRPASLYASDVFGLELGVLANEAATALAKSFSWQALLVEATITGDGVAESFALPADYGRIPECNNLYLQGRGTALRRVSDLNEWLEYKVEGFTPSVHAWIILGGRLHIRPTLGAGDVAKFYYQSSHVAKSDAGVAQSSFKADTDAFCLPERLLTLGVIWRWLEQKRLDYMEPLKNYEIALAEEIALDQPKGMLKSGRVRYGSDEMYAYPGVIIP